jgi:hypothetical protein
VLVDDRAMQGREILRFHDVGHDEAAAAADFGQRRDGLLALALPASRHHDPRAAASEGEGGGASDPGRAAGDEDDLVLKVLHRPPR